VELYSKNLRGFFAGLEAFALFV